MQYSYRANRILFCSFMVQWIYPSSVVTFDQPQSTWISMTWTGFCIFLINKELECLFYLKLTPVWQNNTEVLRIIVVIRWITVGPNLSLFVVYTQIDQQNQKIALNTARRCVHFLSLKHRKISSSTCAFVQYMCVCVVVGSWLFPITFESWVITLRTWIIIFWLYPCFYWF